MLKIAQMDILPDENVCNKMYETDENVCNSFPFLYTRIDILLDHLDEQKCKSKKNGQIILHVIQQLTLIVLKIC